ncbi:LuxR C-terminal-related transcriptional regulator [Laribacter hongkongensis]|nr:LuxR C-terminal-related transcriptional regulator [Laribacter hongkongensis]MCG9035281.1 LuxR C-terminal-related transcriptional regulator [Laribacter hongkongensis]MCG9039139.1 LuxR C-terminal-related transcriptional regulator [Laribacter hongkongensis]MCG9071397.1 LuxR C-terminal-related transcriptional regulator [Laribacter hongkongensis]MCG9073675.1 LuxR C-terminal-related transcriptional regulator [Laribacter hongkongensis]
MRVGNHLSRDGIDGPGALLTEREREVVQALRRGLANKEIARELDISENTVKKHLSSVFQKLGVEDRLQLLIKLA